MPQTVDVLGFVAADLALHDARLGALDPFRLARGEAAAFVEAVGSHEAAQRGIGRHGLEAGLRDEVVVVELDAPAPLWAAYWARTARRTASLTACC